MLVDIVNVTDLFSLEFILEKQMKRNRALSEDRFKLRDGEFVILRVD